MDAAGATLLASAKSVQEMEQVGVVQLLKLSLTIFAMLIGFNNYLFAVPKGGMEGRGGGIVPVGHRWYFIFKELGMHLIINQQNENLHTLTCIVQGSLSGCAQVALV